MQHCTTQTPAPPHPPGLSQAPPPAAVGTTLAGATLVEPPSATVAVWSAMGSAVAAMAAGEDWKVVP